MKIEHLIVQHLYKSKQVTLQGIGTIRLNPGVALPAENDKDFVMPPNAFSFEYNLKTEEDEALINYIVQQTRKIRPLASADLDAYAMLARQFLNIGKPLLIEGVGTIQKNQLGNYVFIPGQFVTPKIDDIPKQMRERTEETVSFVSESRKNNSRRNMLIGVFLLLLILVPIGIYYLVTDKSPEPEAVTVTSDDLPADTTVSTPVVTTIDTSKIQIPDSTVVAATPAPVKTDSSTFKIVLKEYPSYGSVKRAYDRLRTYGHKVQIMPIDSTRYRLALPFTKPLTDTSRVRDSLKLFFGGKPYVLVQ